MKPRAPRRRPTVREVNALKKALAESRIKSGDWCSEILRLRGKVKELDVKYAEAGELADSLIEINQRLATYCEQSRWPWLSKKRVVDLLFHAHEEGESTIRALARGEGT